MAKKLVDLTGATVTVPAGWTASSGYGSFNLLGTCQAASLSSFSFNDSVSNNFKIGYSESDGLNRENYVTMLDDNFGPHTYGSSFSFVFNIIGGDSVTSSNLIQWFVDNGATIEGGVWEEDKPTPVIKNPLTIVNRVEEVSGVPIEISSLDSALLVSENEGKVYKYDGKLYKITTKSDVDDLTGVKVTVPSGWTAIAGYGKFHLAGTISFSGGTIRTFDTSYTSGNFLIGYDNVSDTTKNKIIYRFTPDTAAFITNNTEFILIPTGGNDIAKPSLIQWLKGVGATFENTGYIFEEIEHVEEYDGTIEVV